MSTARIEFLIVAPGAGGIATCLARGAEIKRTPARPAPLPTWPPPGPNDTSHRRSDHARQTGTRSPAPRSNTDRSAAENTTHDITDKLGAERGASVNAGRYGPRHRDDGTEVTERTSI